MILGPEARVLVVVLATYASASICIASIVLLLWRKVAEAGVSATTRARSLFLLRSAPSLLGASLAGIVGGVFAPFESDIAREEVGLPLLVVAALGASFFLGGAIRGIRAARAHAVFARWRRAGTPLRVAGCPLEVRQVHTPLPVVALVGLVRPWLLVTSRVVEGCTQREMAVVIEHELAHHRGRDNLRRSIVSVLPDVLSWLPAGRELERSWHEELEQVADEVATAEDEERRLLLASALVKVSRWIVAAGRPPSPASALCRGEPVAQRVRRLLEPTGSEAQDSPIDERIVGGLLVVVLLALGVSGFFPAQVFEIVEAAVRLGR